jgi:uncharacterized protein (TIGR02646 family)
VRHIQKPVSLSQRELDARHAKPPKTGGEACSAWKNFRHKKAVTSFLTHHQLGLCAYSEIRPDKTTLGVHIEHVKPKSKYPSLTFDVKNLTMNAISSEVLTSIDADNVFGGHRKLGEYDDQFVSCLDPSCQAFFSYISNGYVEASLSLSDDDRSRAEDTIRLLNLNCQYLVSKRKNWIEELREIIDEHIQKGYALEVLASVDLWPVSGLLSEFYSATLQQYMAIGLEVVNSAE